MPTTSSCLWDRLGGELHSISSIWSATPAGVQRKRLILRTATFEAFAGSPGIDTPTAEQLRYDCDLRLAHWQHHLDDEPGRPIADGRSLSISDWFEIPASALSLLTTGLLVGLAFFTGEILIAVLPGLYLWAHRYRLATRLRKALIAQRCPDCGYDLHGCAPGIHEVPRAGPRLCPECGAIWPLLPPPVAAVRITKSAPR